MEDLTKKTAFQYIFDQSIWILCAKAHKAQPKTHETKMLCTVIEMDWVILQHKSKGGPPPLYQPQTPSPPSSYLLLLPQISLSDSLWAPSLALPAVTPLPRPLFTPAGPNVSHAAFFVLKCWMGGHTFSLFELGQFGYHELKLVLNYDNSSLLHSRTINHC
jgi:hypothetical protein